MEISYWAMVGSIMFAILCLLFCDASERSELLSISAKIASAMQEGGSWRVMVVTLS